LEEKCKKIKYKKIVNKKLMDDWESKMRNF